MSPDTELRLIVALAQNPGATSCQLAEQLGWKRGAVSARLGQLFDQRTVWRDRIRHERVSGHNSRIEYRYWLFNPPQAAPPTVPFDAPLALASGATSTASGQRGGENLPFDTHWPGTPRNDLAATARCRRLAAEADRLAALEDAE